MNLNTTLEYESLCFFYLQLILNDYKFYEMPVSIIKAQTQDSMWIQTFQTAFLCASPPYL